MQEARLGRIVNKGMGGFLSPPTHPEHYCSIAGSDFIMSLSSAFKCEWLSDTLREKAFKKLSEWQAPPIDSPEVIDWRHQVLGYFHDCYRNPDVGSEKEWDASNIIVDKSRDPMKNANDHAGVRHIRQFYPLYKPTEEDFSMAYWGTKKA